MLSQLWWTLVIDRLVHEEQTWCAQFELLINHAPHHGHSSLSLRYGKNFTKRRVHCTLSASSKLAHYWPVRVS